MSSAGYTNITKSKLIKGTRGSCPPVTGLFQSGGRKPPRSPFEPAVCVDCQSQLMAVDSESREKWSMPGLPVVRPLRVRSFKVSADLVMLLLSLDFFNWVVKVTSSVKTLDFVYFRHFA